MGEPEPTQQSSGSDAICEFIGNLKVENDNLILALHAIENRFGYVPRQSALLLSKRFSVPLARIYEVLTFYHYFRTTPSAEHTLTICLGTSCWLHGSEKILRNSQNLLAELPPEERQRFGLSEVRCVGCCSLAPLVFAGKKVIGRLTPDKMKQIIEGLLSNRGDIS